MVNILSEPTLDIYWLMLFKAFKLSQLSTSISKKQSTRGIWPKRNKASPTGKKRDIVPTRRVNSLFQRVSFKNKRLILKNCLRKSNKINFVKICVTIGKIAKDSLSLRGMGLWNASCIYSLKSWDLTNRVGIAPRETVLATSRLPRISK